MANEITVQVGLTVQRTPMCLQAAETLLRDQTGTKGLAILPTAPVSTDTTGIQVSIGFNMGFLYVKNLNTNAQASSVDVELAFVAFNASPQVFARLRSGEFCLLPLANLSKTQFYARSASSSVTVPLQVVASEV